MIQDGGGIIWGFFVAKQNGLVLSKIIEPHDKRYFKF